MGGGIGPLILVLLAIAAGLTIMLLVLNARWKSPAQLVRQARENVVGVVALVILAFVAVLIAIFVGSELL